MHLHVFRSLVLDEGHVYHTLLCVVAKGTSICKNVHHAQSVHLHVPRYLVLDEGHRVKNEDALISQGMRQVSRQGVLMLTGTPVQNNLHELYALLNFMFPDVFVSSEPFDRAFNLQHVSENQHRAWAQISGTS